MVTRCKFYPFFLFKSYTKRNSFPLSYHDNKKSSFIYLFNLKIKANPSPKGNVFVFASVGTPKGTRTPDSAVRGQRLNRLTMRAFSQRLIIIPYLLAFCKDFKAFNKKKSGKPLLKIFPTCAD